MVDGAGLCTDTDDVEWWSLAGVRGQSQNSCSTASQSAALATVLLAELNGRGQLVGLYAASKNIMAWNCHNSELLFDLGPKLVHCRDMFEARHRINFAQSTARFCAGDLLSEILNSPTI